MNKNSVHEFTDQQILTTQSVKRVQTKSGKFVKIIRKVRTYAPKEPEANLLAQNMQHIMTTEQSDRKSSQLLTGAPTPGYSESAYSTVGRKRAEMLPLQQSALDIRSGPLQVPAS